MDIGATGAEGLALCDELEPPDLLITDLILPGATGPVIVERMRQRAPEVKVLLMSGYAEHPLLDAAHAAGEPCLVKPFEITSVQRNRSASPWRAAGCRPPAGSKDQDQLT